MFEKNKNDLSLKFTKEMSELNIFARCHTTCRVFISIRFWFKHKELECAKQNTVNTAKKNQAAITKMQV